MTVNPPFNEEKAKQVIHQILKVYCAELYFYHLLKFLLHGLEIMSSHGFMHRDLKPQNIFIYSISEDDIWIKLGNLASPSASKAKQSYIPTVSPKTTPPQKFAVAVGHHRPSHFTRQQWISGLPEQLCTSS